jgi:hypothetical protein
MLAEEEEKNYFMACVSSYFLLGECDEQSRKVTASPIVMVRRGFMADWQAVLVRLWVLPRVGEAGIGGGEWGRRDLQLPSCCVFQIKVRVTFSFCTFSFCRHL